MCIDWQVTLPQSGSSSEIHASQMKGNLFQLIACSSDLSLVQPYTGWCLPLQQFPLTANPRLAESQDVRNYFETHNRSAVSYIHTYLFLCKSSIKWFNQSISIKYTYFKIKHLFFNIARTPPLSLKSLPWLN